MQNILASGDWHKEPHVLSPELSDHLDYIDRKLRSGWLVVLTGDLFDALEYGWAVYESDPILYRVSRWAELSNCIILEGNHDRKSPYYLQRESYSLSDTYFCHGHQFDLLWSWLPVYRFPMPDFLRRWYRTPGKSKKQGKLQDFHISALQVRDTAEAYAIKHSYPNIIIGHNHLPNVDTLEILTYGNTGDFVDSNSWLEREDGKWNGHKLI